MGISVVNALSEWVNVTVYRDGRGLTRDLKKEFQRENCNQRDSKERLYKRYTISFKPDKTIFTGGIDFEYGLLSSRLRELAYLNGGVKIAFRDERYKLKMDLIKKKFIYIKED